MSARRAGRSRAREAGLAPCAGRGSRYGACRRREPEPFQGGMMQQSDRSAEGRWLALPVAGAALAALLAPLLRAPIPLDETRYLQVFRELRAGSWWSLTLNQEPYTEKTPLLFWIGELLHRLGLPADLALRLIPALCVAGTVLVLARLARRSQAPLAPWLLCATVLGLLLTQVLLFDPLLTFGVWGALAAWGAGHDRRAGLWGALAVLAKGPVALLFLLTLGWALAVLRPPDRRGGAERGPGARTWRRGALLLALACLPLAAWALERALLAPESGGALLWDKWGGRIGRGASHARPFWFYLPVLLVGTLPFGPVLLRTGLPPAGTLARRIALASGACLVCLSLIAGKQPHYLLPLMPALALWAGSVLEAEGRAARRALTLGAGLQIGLLIVLLLGVAGFGWGYLDERYGELAQALRSEAGLWVAFGVAAGGLFAAVLAWRGRLQPRLRLFVLCLATCGVLAPLQHGVGRLFLPARLGSLLAASSERPLATYRDFEAGVFNYLGGRLRVAAIDDAPTLAGWWAAHPDGLVVADLRHLDELAGLDFQVALTDRLRGKQKVLLVRQPLTRDGAGAPDAHAPPR